MTDDTSNNYSIADIFQVPSKDIKKTNIILYDDDKNITSETNKDISYTRKNIVDLIEVGHSAISELSTIAAQGQQPLAYEVLATLMKVQLAANKDLLNIHKMNKDLTTTKEEGGPKSLTQNLFVGSTAEMAEMIKKTKKE